MTGEFHTNNKNIEPGYTNGIRIVKCNGKWEEKNNGTNRTAEHE